MKLSRNYLIAALVLVVLYLMFMRPQKSGWCVAGVGTTCPKSPPPPPSGQTCGFPGSVNQPSGCPCSMNTQCKSYTCRWNGKCA